MGYETLIVETNGPLLEVRLNRPAVRNAINAQMELEIDSALDQAEADPGIKVVTFRGEGPVFCAGHDLKEATPDFTGEEHAAPSRRPPHLPRAWYFPKPIVAGVHGFLGPGAIHLIGPFDFIIAAEGTRFSMEQSRLGGGGAGGIEAFQLPMRFLKKLAMMGGWFDAETALQFQYVQRVVPLGEVEAEVKKWGEQLSLMPSDRMAATKQSIHRTYEIMGLANLALVQNRPTGGIARTAERLSFYKMVEEKGLKEALRIRDAAFDPSTAKV